MTEQNELTEFLFNPNAKPAKELSKHDQRMIRLGWDAHDKLAKVHRTRPDREKIARALHETHKKNCKRMWSWNMEDTSWLDLSRDAKRHYRSAATQLVALIL